MTKAYGYIRVSTEDQAKEGISLSSQTKKIEAFCTVNDLDLVEVISDEGMSGKDTDRPGLKKLIELSSSNETEAVVVYKLDRLSRKTRDLLYLIEDVFKKGNTRFFSLTEQIDTNTAMGKFFLTMMGATAQMERELISERTKATLQYKKEQGHSLGRIPYGYDRVDGELIKNKNEQNVIRKMKRWKKEGKSYRKIAILLNEKGIPSRIKSAKWHDSAVWYIINSKKNGK